MVAWYGHSCNVKYTKISTIYAQAVVNKNYANTRPTYDPNGKIEALIYNYLLYK